jgi:hypothetical protein
MQLMPTNLQQSKIVDNVILHKSKRGKKSKTYFLVLFCMSRIALFCSF